MSSMGPMSMSMSASFSRTWRASESSSMAASMAAALLRHHWTGLLSAPERMQPAARADAHEWSDLRAGAGCACERVVCRTSLSTLTRKRTSSRSSTLRPSLSDVSLRQRDTGAEGHERGSERMHK